MSQEAENAVIGAALHDATAIDVAIGIISSADFLDEKRGKLFALLCDMHAEGLPVDDLTTTVSMARKARLATATDLGELLQLCPNPKLASQYAKEVWRAAELRRLVDAAKELAARAVEPHADPAQIANWLDAKLARARRDHDGDGVSLAEAMQMALDEIKAARSGDGSRGLTTGLWRLDEALGGLYPGELIIVAARPSVGKSAFSCQAGIHNATRGRHVMFASLEMKATELALRKLSAEIGVEVRQLRAGCLDEPALARAGAHVSELQGVDFLIWAQRSATMAKIRSAARVRKAIAGLDLLVVDYLGLIEASDPRAKRWESITKITGELKSLAMELDIPVVVPCQLNREAETTKARLDHLRDSGSIEQDADVVMFLHRQDRDSTSAELTIAKNRNGVTGTLSLGFDCERTEFNCDPEWEG